MTAKQTLASASLVVVLGGVGIAQADPAPAAPDGEASPRPQQPKPTGTFEVGAGYVTDDGFIARAAISQSNLFGTGNLLELDAAISQRRELFDAHFADPHVLDTDFRLDAHLYNDRRLMPGFTRAAVGGSLEGSHPLGDHVIGFVGYKLEHVDPSSGTDLFARATDPTAPGALGPDLRPYDVAAIRAGLRYSTLDTPLAPRRGSTLGASLEVADPRLGSGIQYTRADAWASTHQPLGALTFHLYGHATAIGSPIADSLPISERLFLDGSRDLPGFAVGALGPASGGNFLASGRAELEVPVIRSLGLSVIGFYGAASVYDWRGNGTRGQSAGVGLAWRSPLGLIRLDYAIPLGGGAPGIVFGIGERL